MTEFVQIIKLRTDKYDEIQKLDEEYVQKTSGRSTFTQEIVGRDLDTGEYVVIVRFPSKEAADVNNDLPETGEMSAKMAALATSMTFSNLEVIEHRP